MKASGPSVLALDLALNSPRLITLVAAVATVSFAVSARHWGRAQWGRFAARFAVIQIAVSAAGALVERLVAYRWPWSFHVWIALALCAIVSSVASPRGEGRPHRGRVVVPGATTLLAVLLINSFYAYFPTLSAVLGRRAHDEISPRDFAALRVATTRPSTPPSAPLATTTSTTSTATSSTTVPTATAAAAATPAAAFATADASSARLAPGRDATRRHVTHGVVVAVDFPATVSRFRHRRGALYLPPAWFRAPRPQLPAILVLSGTPGSTADWTRAGAADLTADRFAATHGGIAPILVFADENGSAFGDSECVDRRGAAAETYLVDDVRAAVIDDFGASPLPSQWAVVGASEGGTCALTLALRHPDRFRSFADFSGDLAPNLGSRRHTLRALFADVRAQQNHHDPRWLLAHLPASQRTELAGVLDVGRSDTGPRRAASLLALAARQAHVDVSLRQSAGRHNYRFWRRAFERTLPWLAGRLAITTPQHAPAASVTP